MATDAPSRTPARPRKPACRIYVVRKKTIREFHLRPWLVVTAAVLGTAFFVAYFAATGYLFFRDDLLAASFAREARQKQAYEDRIAALRVDIDRLSSRQLLDQEAFEARLETVASRQAALDERQEILAGLSKAARNAGLVTTPGNAGDDAESDDTLTTGSIEPDSAGPDQVLAGVESSLDDLGVRQVDFLEEVATNAADRSERIAVVLKEIGRAPPKAKGDSAMGGPFVPMPSNVDPDTFRDGVELVKAEIARLETLQETASGLPLTTPMSRGSITSRFGMRTDPFRRRPAMHTGIDFRAPTGQPARATAGGKIISAGYNRGYGNMVEIDHGNGLTTRFAHLSKIQVKKGQTVAKGDTVGQTGSTGRSTGPHLHYEIRVNGRAIDPMTFIRAGEQLSPVL
ncbi:MAG: peptidoglycan DD-metalloendopeptidase family protein [Bauldia sp.]|nr:peptidoglycan DD-metalloendopeptidase family protein [Bauldia sp.]